jgi:hypothetical protein
LAAVLIAPGARPALAEGGHKQTRTISAKLVYSVDAAPAVHAHLLSKLSGRIFVGLRIRTDVNDGQAFLWYGGLNERIPQPTTLLPMYWGIPYRFRPKLEGAKSISTNNI